MTTRTDRAPRTPARGLRSKAGIAALTAMVFLSQWLGLAHAYAHGLVGMPKGAAPHAAETALAAPPVPAAATVRTLFAGHEEGGGVCELFDHLLHAQPVVFALPCAVGGLGTAAAPAAVERAEPYGAPFAGYLARGPPTA